MLCKNLKCCFVYFQESEPLDTWETRHAKTEGPICYQTDVLYGRFMQPYGMNEDCLYANIHVPINVLPMTDRCEPPAIELEPSKETPDESVEMSPSRGLPILVFIHGGGFAFGSGDSDLYGPEYLVSKNVIVITFNYRYDGSITNETDLNYYATKIYSQEI